MKKVEMLEQMFLGTKSEKHIEVMKKKPKDYIEKVFKNFLTENKGDKEKGRLFYTRLLIN